MTERITVRRHQDQWRTHTVQIAYRRTEPGRYQIVRADNGCRLGWITKTPEGWEARASAEAFRGHDHTDRGHLLDYVPGDLTNSPDGVHHDPVGSGSARSDAAYDLVCHLVRNQAPAAGFGPHPAVRPWTGDT